MPNVRSPRSAALVVNAGSRSGRASLDAAAGALRAAGVDVAVALAVPGDQVGATAGRLVADGHDLLVVGGGDGTVGAVAGQVAGTGVVLGVLPLGTANDLARTLQIPSDLSGAAATVAGGRVVDVDLGRAGDAPFLNVASVGLAVGVTEALSPRLKRRIGPLAYPLAAVVAYRRHLPFRARLEFPDGDHPPLDLGDLLQVSVANGRHFGGGSTASPTAHIDDHLLDVAVIRRGRLREHVSIALLLRTGRFVEHDRVEHVRTRRVRLVTEPGLRLNLDGELVGRTPTDLRVERNAVHVLVPEHAVGATWDGEDEPPLRPDGVRG